MAKLIKILLVCCLLFGIVAAQSNDLEQLILDRKKAELDTLKANGYFAGYFSPVISTMGTGVINGLWKDASISGTGLKLYIGLEVMTVLVPNELLLFNTPTKYNSEGSVNTATIFGGKPAVVKDETTGLVVAPYLPGFLPSEGGFMPLAAPQITIGKVFGTAVSGRFLLVPDNFGLGEAMELEEQKSITLMAGGVAHSVSQYIPAMPMDIALAFSYGNVNLLDIITTTAMGVDVNIGKKLPFLNAMLGVGWEKSNGTVNFDLTDIIGVDGLVFKLDEPAIEGLTQFHANVGLTLKLAFFSVHSVFHAGKQLSVSSGLGIEF